MKIIRSYNLKIYANKTKLKKINMLLSYWRDQVNHYIKLYWEFRNKKRFAPKEIIKCGRLQRDASTKAWQIVKGARKYRKRPYFEGNEIDLCQFSAYIIPEFKTKEFDIWFNIINLELRHRLKIPCKRTKLFNDALQKGKLKKSFKLLKIKNDYYIQCFVEFPKIEKKNNDLLGVDVNLNNTIVTSDGRFLGKELKDIRIRTKHRNYKKKLSPFKQGLNYYSNMLPELYPGTDFVVEDLLFKGKKGRTKEFRRRNINWAYKHLANKLEEIGNLKGFQVIRINPINTSIQCPKCGFISKENRREDRFVCKKCDYSGHSDHIASINIVERVSCGVIRPLNQTGGV